MEHYKVEQFNMSDTLNKIAEVARGGGRVQLASALMKQLSAMIPEVKYLSDEKYLGYYQAIQDVTKMITQTVEDLDKRDKIVDKF